MKILVVTGINENNANTSMRVRSLADSAVLPSRKPFFVPDFASRFTCRPALCVRIDRLGKHIAQRYAHRYYNSVAACGLVCAHEMADSTVCDDADARSNSFDGALLLGDFVPYDGEPDVAVSLTTETGASFAWSCTGLPETLHAVITELSRYMTLKMGDLIVLPADDNESVELHIGGELNATVAGVASLRTIIR